MKNSYSRSPNGDTDSAAPQDTGGFSPWQQLKSKRISYLTLPLIIMATVVEFVILATGWKYQQLACLPQGMGVTFFSIGPIGATILAVELLKLPLAIWTASRVGWQKGFMLVVGLPLICVLTFQLVKDMAVYEMGVAMAPAGQMLEKAMVEETKISQLNGELAGVEEKRTERERKLAALTEKHAKAKSDLEESIKRNSEVRQDAISLTEYQKKELAEVETRQATIIQQFNADTEQLKKSIAELHARRETEVTRNSKWNAEEARIENAYKVKASEYANKKAAYEKAKAEYESANFLKRQLMKEPVSPGVPPERETNTVLKPTAVAEIDAQLQAKETELLAVNNKRRDRVAQVEADARRVREEFDRRSGTKREESDRKREELSATLAALTKEEKAERDAIDQEFASVLLGVDRIRAEVDACRKKAEGFYEAREEAIRNTQVHRIATTVEIVRGLILGERPMSIKATAKERGDILTDQISMVRIWVYPVLAFIVAFLPTLMVEIGFSTLFKPEQQRPPYRLGFMGRRLHWLYTRAGRQKILRAERIAKEASAEIAGRDKALAIAKATADQALVERESELQAARQGLSATSAELKEQLKRLEAECQEQLQQKEEHHQEKLKQKEGEWVAKFTDLADSLNRAVIEKDALRDLQKSEIERQIQMRKNAWSDRLTQMRQELDDQRAAVEAERTAMLQEHQTKLLEVTEECKTQVIQARRQMAAAELAAVETTARLSHDLKEAMSARDAGETQLKRQADSFSFQLAQAKEDATREMEKAIAQEKHRTERQQQEFDKALRRRDEDLAHQMKQREQDLSIAFEARLVEQKAKVEQEARHREAELERQVEARSRELDGRWKLDVQQREEAGQIRLKQREQQLLAQAEARVNEVQAQAEQDLRRRELESERQLEAQSREADARLRQELQQKELAFHAKLKQREQEFTAKAVAREIELQNQWAANLRAREEEWDRQAESHVRATETRLGHEAQLKEENFQIKLRQREQQLQSQSDARQAELQAQWEQELHSREQEWERKVELGARAIESRWTADLQQRELAFQAKLKQREQELAIKVDARETELQTQWASELRAREEEWGRQAESRVRATEARLGHEAQQKEETLQIKLRQREQQLQAQFEARQAELRTQWEQELRGHEQERERNAEACTRATEARWMAEIQQKEELFQSKLRQRDQQWQVKLDAARAELQTQTEQDLRRREAESADARLRALRELESHLRQEMQQKDEAAQAKAKQLEQDLVAQLTAQTEARYVAAQAQWELESEKRARAAIEPFKVLLVRAEKERDEAKHSASEAAHHVQSLEKKLTEASSFLNGWRNGKHLVGAA